MNKSRNRSSTSCNNVMEGKIIIISAPSGCGKSTIINAILAKGEIDMQFSVSATSREPRGQEVDGTDYYFLTPDDFRARIEADAFVEFEEVYPGRYYGTLKSEVERITADGHNVILDIDVKGGVNVKKLYGDRAVSIFIKPPSIETLRERLTGRATDSPEAIEQRVGKAALELTYAPAYDNVVINDNLDAAIAAVEKIIKDCVSR